MSLYSLIPSKKHHINDTLCLYKEKPTSSYLQARLQKSFQTQTTERGHVQKSRSIPGLPRTFNEGYASHLPIIREVNWTKKKPQIEGWQIHVCQKPEKI